MTSDKGADVPCSDSINDDARRRDTYFAELNAWMKEAHLSLNAAAMFPLYLAANYPQMFQGHIGTRQTTSASMAGSIFQRENGAPVANFNALDEAGQADFITRRGGQPHTLAPLWKRAVAEGIDIVILLLVKFAVTFVVINLLGLDFGIEVDNDNVYIQFFEKPIELITFSTDFILIEVVTKFIVCCYEALWTAYNKGATPGKALMKLRVVYVEALAVRGLQLAQQPRLLQTEPIPVLLYPAETPKLIRAFARSLMKNTIVILFFPVCVAMLFFKHNRTAYDIWAKTVVVDNTADRQQLLQ